MRPANERNKHADVGQLNVVKSCHDYAVLHMHDQIGLRLTPAERRMLRALCRLLEGDAARHRRNHRRFPLMLPITIRSQRREHRGTAINISGGGMFLMCPDDLPAGTTVDLVIGPPHERYRFTGVVMWTRGCGERKGLGIRFSAVPLLRSIAPRNAPIVTNYTAA